MPQLFLAAQHILQEWEPAKITDNLAQLNALSKLDLPKNAGSNRRQRRPKLKPVTEVAGTAVTVKPLALDDQLQIYASSISRWSSTAPPTVKW